MTLRIVFMGTPDFSVASLKALIEAGHDIACVYTQPPRPAGRRGLELKPSPVHLVAEEHGIEVRRPLSLKSEDEQEKFTALNADVAVVVAYGLLLPKAILDAPKFGCYNGHASKLPRWRGAAPIQRAIMAGDQDTAMMIMKMGEGLDTGPVAMSQTVMIEQNMTAGELHDALMNASGPLMVEAMSKLEAGVLPLTPQPDDGITYAKKIDKGETRIDFRKTAQEVHNHIRGLSPFPGAWLELTLGKKTIRVKILQSEYIAQAHDQECGFVLDDQLTIACGNHAVRLTKLQKAGSKAMDATEFLRGTAVTKGMIIASV